MKNLYLQVTQKGWVAFDYNDLSDLSYEFSIRNIRIGNGCRLGNDCELGDGCELGYGCILGDGCELGYGCILGNDCEPGDDCRLGNGCILGDGCELGDDCRLGNGCILGNGCKVKHTLCIHASRHTITYWGCDAIQIGCKQYTIFKWLSLYEKIGRSENYSEKEIAEYWMYIDLIKRIHESGVLI